MTGRGGSWLPYAAKIIYYEITRNKNLYYHNRA